MPEATFLVADMRALSEATFDAVVGLGAERAPRLDDSCAPGSTSSLAHASTPNIQSALLIARLR